MHTKEGVFSTFFIFFFICYGGCTRASYSPSLNVSISPFSKVIMTFVFLHSKDLSPCVPHLKHVMFLVPVDALDEAVEGAGCFMQLWMVGCLDGMEEEVWFRLVVGVLGVSFEAK